jgi:hypothetical protein
MRTLGPVEGNKKASHPHKKNKDVICYHHASLDEQIR